jgi:hypothetical protein
MNSDITKLSYQQKNRPKIEDVVPFLLTDEKQNLALDFIAWLRENKMSPGWAGYHNAWDSNCKGKNICKISLRKDGWGIALVLRRFDDYKNTVVDEGLQNLIWDMLLYCRGGELPDHRNGECEAKCISKKRNLTGEVLGRRFEMLCRDSNVTRFRVSTDNPGAERLAGVKRLIELEQKARKTVSE